MTVMGGVDHFIQPGIMGDPMAEIHSEVHQQQKHEHIDDSPPPSRVGDGDPALLPKSPTQDGDGGVEKNGHSSLSSILH
ncbi:MAG: hypothetical protein RL015_3653 [Verrucomicrobiota bacterium]|jgi:hypothetical protein